MATYEQLRDRALGQTGTTGMTEPQTIAQYALEEAMRFVASHVRIQSLIGSATATAPADAHLETNAITLGVSGFNISSSFQCIDRLYVKKDSSVVGRGTPYEYVEYDYFHDLKAAPGSIRVGVYDAASYDERPMYSYTLTPDGKIWSTDIAEDNVLTLVFQKTPAAYSGSSTPEILTKFDYILVDAAVIAIKEWQKEPAEIVTLRTLFQNGLMNDVKLYAEYLKGQYKRDTLKVHRDYRID